MNSFISGCRAGRRGTLMLGMAALIFVLSMLCAAVLMRSLETYRSSARLEQRLQLQAAAEGTTAVLLAGDPLTPPATLEIGDAHVVLTKASSENGNITVPFTVALRSEEGTLFTELSYRARFTRGGGTGWRLAGLERVP